jgi:hypothetical protein
MNSLTSAPMPKSLCTDPVCVTEKSLPLLGFEVLWIYSKLLDIVGASGINLDKLTEIWRTAVQQFLMPKTPHTLGALIVR